MKKILFYKTKLGKSPIDDFLDSLSAKDVQKVLWVFKLIRESDIVSSKFLKRLTNSNNIIEVRVQHGNNNFRFLGFEHKDKIIVLTNGFRKKDQKIPRKEILLAQKRMMEYLNG
ncbi:MAG: type II toxin-antitoxin system RelE/ParE family toxin [Halarcobacter sp.]